MHDHPITTRISSNANPITKVARVFEFSKRSLRVLAQVDENLQAIFLEAIQECPIDFGIPNSGGKRTAEFQNDLFLGGKSKCDGYENLSYHQTGNAIDVYAYVDGKASWDIKHLTIIADTIKRVALRMGIDIEWGGDWTKFVDMPHYQLAKIGSNHA